MAKDDAIADEVKNQKTQDAQDARIVKQRQVRLVEDGVKTNYSGIFNIGFGAEEVVFIFGNPSVEPNVVRIDSKVAVSLKNAKRIAVTLGNLIRRYEAANGVIDISVPAATSASADGEAKPKIQ
jgi:hypothetical protein